VNKTPRLDRQNTVLKLAILKSKIYPKYSDLPKNELLEITEPDSFTKNLKITSLSAEKKV
jgi:hypothetical protein